jgi:hypothetical protein
VPVFPLAQDKIDRSPAMPSSTFGLAWFTSALVKVAFSKSSRACSLSDERCQHIENARDIAAWLVQGPTLN